ncbi:MAG: PAS domain S-box protein [Candidatus Peregrinibacteria bacterium]|nr:PAS domain S-box protein [Candidatus Peregrinibacteria bacterium]
MSDRSLPPLTELVSPRTLQRIQDNFAEALGISSQILDLEGNEVTSGRIGSGFLNDICQTQNREVIKVLEMKRVYIYECAGSIYWFAVPILVDERPIGLIKGGQVRLGNPDLAECKRIAKRLGVNFEEYLEQYLSLPYFTRERLTAAANLLKLVAGTISSMAYLVLLSQKQVEQVTSLNELLEEEIRSKSIDLERSEERFRSLVNNAEDVIYTVNSGGVLTSINTAIQLVTGYAPEEVRGRHFKSFVHPDDFDSVHDSFVSILRKEKPGTSGLEFRLLHKKGGVRWVQLNSRAIRDDEDEFVEIEGVLRDITRTHQIERQLRESERNYRLIFEKAAEPIFLMDQSGKCLNVNQSMLDLMGYTKSEEIEGRPMLDFVPGGLYSFYLQEAIRISKDGDFKNESMKIVFLTREETHILTEMSVSLISEEGLYMCMLHNAKRLKSLEDGQKTAEDLNENS